MVRSSLSPSSGPTGCEMSKLEEALQRARGAESSIAGCATDLGIHAGVLAALGLAIAIGEHLNEEARWLAIESGKASYPPRLI